MLSMRALALFCLVAAAQANVIGLDFGTDSMKIALVAPGSPLEIVTNFQSKRKTPTCITFYRGERMFGSDSYALMARKPELTFTKTYRMLGRSIEHPQVNEIVKNQYFPYEVYTNETTNGACVKQKEQGFDETYYTPEELMSMMMQHAKDITSSFGGQTIKDCVITVPAHFTQHERRALYTAAEIADLRILTLMEENTAAALHYGIDRVFENPHTILYYNMGASSVQVSVVTYSSYGVKEGGKNKTIGQFEVVGKAWDHSLGGFNFDIKLAELLADRFNEAWGKKASGKGKDLKDFVRPMTRLRLEANKIKEVLSANNEFPVRAEQLHAEVDLNTKVTRAEFEAACESLFARLTAPIDMALAMANITIDQVNAVELLGGGVRMPRVKKTIDDYFKASKIEVGQHINGDEAMALGAAFRAANLSTAFRVRKVGVSDISNFGVQVQMENLGSTSKKSGGFLSGLFGKSKEEKKVGDEAEGEPWIKKTGLYKVKASVPARPKTVAFQHDQDILCRIEYDSTAGSNSLPEGTSNLLAVYNITGITEFAEENSGKGLGLPKIHLSFALDSSGIVLLSKAEATIELPPDKDDDEEKKEAPADGSISPEASSTEPNNTTDAEAPSSAEANDTTSTDTKKDAKDGKDKKKDAKKKDKKKVKKDKTLRRILTIQENINVLTPPVWTHSQVLSAKARLRALDAADKARRDREAALNDLEGYIYKVKNRFEDEAEALSSVSTPEQREEIEKLCSTASEWLEEDGHKAELSDFKAKLKDISDAAEMVFSRYSELKKRPAAVKQAMDLLVSARAAVNIWNETHPQITEEEKEKFLEAVTAAEMWMEKSTTSQEAKKPHEQPAFHSKEVKPITDAVALKMQTLLKKPKPKPAPIAKEVRSSFAVTLLYIP